VYGGDIQTGYPSRIILEDDMFREVRFMQKFLSTGMICILVSIWLFSLFGCEQPPPPPPPPAKVEKTEPPPATEKKEEAGAQVEPTPTYFYDAKGRREPFKSLLREELPPEEDPLMPPNPAVLLTPLQKFELKQLKITGIILGGLGDYARVSAPDGKSYTINVGTLIGNNEGTVVSITDNIVMVKETFHRMSGKVETVETPMYLTPVKEGGKP
jgi:Tfp pilus assembly protein PilP